jgi:lysophospholipase L1-like esterase
MILTIGDSWTKGYGLANKTHSWPYVLSKLTSVPIKVSARSGADNDSIGENAIKSYRKYKPDIVIIGWSGISRIRHSKKPYVQYSLSQVPNEDIPARKEFFKNSTLNNLSKKWIEQIEMVEQNVDARVIHFSVFGDQHSTKHKNLLEKSMLEFIAEKQKTNFKYNIPIFEFDFLHQDNLVAKKFCKRELGRDWKRACVERENLRSSKMFFDCGHPNQKGHAVWADYIKDIL